ncbi:MAG: carbon-nitrogen hydrolase family protein [Geminicoccaceae bacterium]
MRVAALQMSSQPDKAANLAQARELIAAAVAADRPDLVVLPEVWAFQGGTQEERRNAAEAIPGGEAYATLAEAARRHRVFVHGGSFMERDGERLWNTTVAFDRDGNELARYRKIHLFDVVTPDGREYRESALVGSGREVVTYQAEDIRVGCSICYDIRFPELYRQLVDKGAQLIMVPAAFTLMTGKDHWDVLLRARAIESQCYVAAAAQVGSYKAGNDVRQCWGHSMVIDPWGHLLAQVAQDRPGWTTARLDLGWLEQVRQNLPSLQHRVLG